jgi:hypothetical protein
MRRILVSIAVLAALLLASPVAAADNGCGAGFDLKTVDETIARVDPRIYTPDELADLAELITAEDGNGDGLLCSKQYAPNRGQDKQWIGPEDTDVSDYVITLILDNKAVGRGS